MITRPFTNAREEIAKAMGLSEETSAHTLARYLHVSVEEVLHADGAQKADLVRQAGMIVHELDAGGL